MVKSLYQSLLKVLLSIFIALLFTSEVFAQRGNYTLIGPRTVGMGSAFIAVANDGLGVYWNPAALARMEHFHLNWSRAEFDSIDLRADYISLVLNPRFAPKIAKYLTFGLDWMQFQDTSQDSSRVLSEELHFAMGLRPFQGLLFLQNLTFGVSTRLSCDPAWNFGLLYSFPYWPQKSFGRLNFGLMIHDRYENPARPNFARRNVIFDRYQIRYGLSCQIFRNLWNFYNPMISFDYGERIHLGLEISYRPVKFLKIAARYGIQRDIDNQNETKSYGITLQFNKPTPATTYSDQDLKREINLENQAASNNHNQLQEMNSTRLLVERQVVEKQATSIIHYPRASHINFHYARTNSPIWDHSKHYGVEAVIESADLTSPTLSESKVCPSNISLNWQGSEEEYEDGFIIQRDPTEHGAGYWFIAGLGSDQTNYPDNYLLPGRFLYLLFSFKDNIDKKYDVDHPLRISRPSNIDETTKTVSWFCNIKIRHVGMDIFLTFGQADTAKNGYDTGLCEQELAPPARDIFDARFELPISGSPQSLIDFRRYEEEDDDVDLIWYINIQRSDSEKPVIITWDNSTFPEEEDDDEIMVKLKNLADVQLEDMKANTSYRLEDNTINSLKIVFKKRAPE